jgi:transcriptional regulator with XRE-family HTH domain
MNQTETPKKIHHGRNLKGLRTAIGVSQDQLAEALGEAWNQKRISDLEAKEEIEQDLLEKVAKGLKVPVEAIKNFSQEALIYYIQNNYEGAHAGTGQFAQNFNQCSFNPLDKYVEAVEDYKKVVEKNEKLYQDLLKTEREKIALMERLLNEKKK